MYTRSSGRWGSYSTAACLVLLRPGSATRQRGRLHLDMRRVRSRGPGGAARCGGCARQGPRQDDRRGVHRCAHRRRVAGSRPIRQAVTCRASSLCASSSLRELAGLLWLRGDLGSLLGGLRPRRQAAFLDRLLRLFRRGYTPWRRPGPDLTLRRRSTRCLPSATVTARLLPDDRERTHRGHDCGLFPCRPPHPQERTGHAGHDPIAGSLADFLRKDLHAITNDCHIPNGATPRRVWPARSHTFCPQKPLAPVQRAELEGAGLDPGWLRHVTAGLVPSAVVLGARGTRGVRPWDGVGAGVRITEAYETHIRTVLDNPLSAEQRGT